MFEQNKHKIVYYYLVGSFAVLLFLKLVTSRMFQDLVETILTLLPFIIIAAMIIHGFVKYRKKPEDALAIRKHVLTEILFLLFITLIFYVLYSPAAFIPLTESLSKLGSIFSVDTFFVILSYASMGVVAFSLIFIFYKLYQKSQGKYQGSVQELFRKTLYSVFFVLVFFLTSSAAIFPGSYSPITGFVSDIFFLMSSKGSDVPNRDDVAQKRISSLKNVLGDTFRNLSENLGTSTEKLTTTVSETKETLDKTITRTNTSLKKSLSNDIEDRLDITGGTLAGDLTVEDDLDVEGTTTTGDIVPADDDTYDLGSVVDGWNALYIHSIHGSSIITIGDGSTSHGMSGSDDLLISGDLEVNGMAYLDGGANLNSQKITNVADPTDAQDVVTKAYYEANTPAGVFSRNDLTDVIYPTNSGDTLNMLDAVINNIGNAGTDFTSGGGLTLAGVLAASSASAHNLGPVTFTNGAVTGVTSLGMSGALTAGSGSAHTIGSITITADNIAGLPATPAGATSAASKAYVDAQDSVTGYQNGSGVTLNMADGVIENIGAAGTDFSGGGLTLAGNLTLGSNTITTSNTTVITNLNADTTDGYSLNQNVLTSSSPSFASLTIDNIGLDANTISTSTGNLTIDPNGSSDVDLNGSELINIGNSGTDFDSSGGLTLASTLNVSDNNITNVGDVALDSISSDAGTSIAITLGSDAGDDLIVDTTTLVVEGDNNQVGIGTATPSALLDLQKAGTAKSNLDIFELTNSGNASDMDATSTSLLFNQFYYDASTPAVADAGRITVGTETDWTSTATTQDSYMAFSTALDGNITEGMRINSSGQVLINALQSGAQAFPDDAGVTQWVDLPITSAAASTVESYSAMLDGSAVMTIYGTSNGSGGVTTDSQSVGIMTATPAATLHVVNNDGAGATNQGLLLHLDNDAFAGISSTATNAGGGLVITADSSTGSAFDFFAAISDVDGTDDTEFRLRGDGNAYADGTWAASGADYAEFFYTKNTDLSAGELVCVDVTGEKAVKRCTRANDLDLIGIISTKPAFVGNNIPGADADLGETNKNYKLVGLIGQVPAKVTNENGKIKSGDSLTSASKSGYAMKANAGDSTVGVALENSDKEDGVITVLISRRNKSLTVEQVEEETTRRIAEMNIEDEVNAIVAGAREELLKDSDDKFAALEIKDSELENRINTLESAVNNLDPNNQADLIAEVQEQMNLIKEENKAIMDFFLAINPETLVYKNADGNLDLLDGKLIAKEVETGGIVIAVADEDKASIGEGKILAIVKDENNDSMDDETGSDGKSVIIKTKAVSENSKVFVTAKTATEQPLAVTDIQDGEGFNVEITSPTEEDTEFDWWIVETK